jgi:hypothetical protein
MLFNFKNLETVVQSKHGKEISDMKVMHVLEKPEGQYVVLKAYNSENEDDKRIEILTKPRKGLGKDLLIKVKEIIKNSEFKYMLDNTPIKEYVLHTIFYGKEFSKEIPYSNVGFVIVALEHSGHICTYDEYEYFLEHSDMTKHRMPELLKSFPRIADAKNIKTTSILSSEGIGTGAIIMFEPSFHPDTGRHMMFIA